MIHIGISVTLAAVFMTVALIAWTIGNQVVERSSPTRRRLNALTDGDALGVLDDVPGGATSRKGTLVPISPKDILATIYQHLDIDDRHNFLDHTGQLAFHAHSFGNFDDFLSTFVIEINGPVIYPVGPLLRQDIARDDAFLVLVELD